MDRGAWRAKVPGAPKSRTRLRDFTSHTYMLVAQLSLTAISWTVACKAPLSMGFSKEEFWSGLPFPSPVDLPNPGIKSGSLTSPALVGKFFTTSATSA